MKNKFEDFAEKAGVATLAEAMVLSEDVLDNQVLLTKGRDAHDAAVHRVIVSLRLHTQLLIGKLKAQRVLASTPEAEGLIRSMNPKYEPKTLEQKLGYLVEECGETMAAVGKSLRWGLESCNPELPVTKQESNRAWILRELRDLRRAIQFVEDALNED